PNVIGLSATRVAGQPSQISEIKIQEAGREARRFTRLVKLKQPLELADSSGIVAPKPSLIRDRDDCGQVCRSRMEAIEQGNCLIQFAKLQINKGLVGDEADIIWPDVQRVINGTQSRGKIPCKDPHLYRVLPHDWRQRIERDGPIQISLALIPVALASEDKPECFQNFGIVRPLAKQLLEAECCSFVIALYPVLIIPLCEPH